MALISWLRLVNTLSLASVAITGGFLAYHVLTVGWFQVSQASDTGSVHVAVVNQATGELWIKSASNGKPVTVYYGKPDDDTLQIRK